jgi:type 1 glutamine amidotransferase
MRRTWCWLLSALLLTVLGTSAAVGQQPAKTKKILLIGMNRDHGPGEHEYMAGLAILAECLKQTPGAEVKTVKAPERGKGFPVDDKTLEESNCIVFFLRAGGGYLKEDAERRTKIEQVLKKGAGFVALHWAVEGPKDWGNPYMALLGGYYEPGYSKNPHNTATVEPVDPGSPFARGWKPFQARDEFYFNIRLLPDAKPAIRATLKDRDGKTYENQTIGWTYVRKDSQGPLGLGRSFGFTGCHFHVNFGIPEFRRLIVNGVLWSAGLEVPAEGAPVRLDHPVPKVPTQS